VGGTLVAGKKKGWEAATGGAVGNPGSKARPQPQGHKDRGIGDDYGGALAGRSEGINPLAGAKKKTNLAQSLGELEGGLESRSMQTLREKRGRAANLKKGRRP